ncbi:hypothetical protein AB0C61_14240 [Streptomyces sp. NPDC048680]|uniref:hypothetical protein n=1 Tax=Streptomyces sp. NPDC048680 TaxID=3155492 RepID=UPI003428B839
MRREDTHPYGFERERGGGSAWGTNLQVLSWNMCDVVRWGGCTERRTAQKVALLKQKVQGK